MKYSHVRLHALCRAVSSGLPLTQDQHETIYTIFKNMNVYTCIHTCIHTRTRSFSFDDLEQLDQGSLHSLIHTIETMNWTVVRIFVLGLYT